MTLLYPPLFKEDLNQAVEELPQELAQGTTMSEFWFPFPSST